MLINRVRDDFRAVFLIIILKDEQQRNGLDLPVPPGIKTFNYIQQMAFGWTLELEEHVVRLPGGDGCLDAQTQRKPYGQRDQEGKRSNGEWQVQMVEQNMVQTRLKGQ